MSIAELSSLFNRLRSFREASARHPRARAAEADDTRYEPLEVDPDGSLVPLERGSWFVCFVPPIDRQWWHPFLHRAHKHVFALRPERAGEWTVFEPWWSRLLAATITSEQARKFLCWGARGDVLLVREAVPGHSSQFRGMMTCGALISHLLGRRYFVWTPHQLYRALRNEPYVCHVDVSALLRQGLDDVAATDSRTIWACEACRPRELRRRKDVIKPFCMRCGRDLGPADK
jgi:hypothetical protein